MSAKGVLFSMPPKKQDFGGVLAQFRLLARIMRAADAKGQEATWPEGIGLRSIAQRFAALGISDEEQLVRQFPVYDALYAYVQGSG